MARWIVSPSADQLLYRVRAYLPSLSGASLAVAQHVLDDPTTVVSLSISELASLSGTSQASVTRFCRTIGLSGYAEFRLKLASDLGRATVATWDRDLGSSIAIDDPPERVASVLAAAGIHALQDTSAQLDHDAVVHAAEAIASAPRCIFYGVAGSAMVAQEAQLRLHRIGRPVWAFSDVHQAKVSAALLAKGDVFVGISRSGRTREVIETMTEAHEHGATTIALTSFPGSALVAEADIVLTTPVHDTDTRHGSLAARYAQLLVIDCLYSLVAQQTYDVSVEALASTAQALAPSRRPGAVARRKPAARAAGGASS
jgi:DNA-binding MurR/RpiR family transcriptional regulator